MKDNRYVMVSNNYIKDISRNGGCNAFGLYMNLLYNKSWNDDFHTTPKILLYLLGRSNQYLKNVISQLSILKQYGLIDYNFSGTNYNDYIHIKVKPANSPFTKSSCVNQSILSVNSVIEPNTLLAVHTCLKMAQDKDLKYATISATTIADYLGVVEKTVRKALTVLEAEGLISIFHG